MARFGIDISNLPYPGVLEPLSYEAILAAMKADLLARYPFADLESEPLVALLETCAYYRLIDRARVNDASKASFIAYATGRDLDNLAAFYGVTRRTITPADPDANPPVAAVMESDRLLRRRALLALEAFSTAGPRGAYLYHTLSADTRVADAAVIGPDDLLVPGPAAGNVWVYVLGTGGSTPPDLLTAVAAALNAEDVRPLCDTVTVLAAGEVTYTIEATITLYARADPVAVMEAARLAAIAYGAARYRLGHDITISGVLAALHQEGVMEVTLTQPAARIARTKAEVARLTAVTLTNGGVGE